MVFSGSYYTLANQSAIFKVEKPLGQQGIGFDNLPESLKQSHILSANNLAQLANCEHIPTEKEIESFIKELGKLNSAYARNLNELVNGTENLRIKIEKVVAEALKENDTTFAWNAVGWLQLKESNRN